ncbi:hypothetical protein AVEN_163623-1 [Araneus ventricosus]|uniref:Uncharacterized protein n=1 Tax=Araneus ventricosus TaxID=182803 RepID=A0A4Y2KE27_ARAVE|nr:hypothetical protein AVEN_163623-1 [Araneus ventricosus]
MHIFTPFSESVTSSTHERKSSILHRGEEDGLRTRKVSTSNTENRAPGESLPKIKPTETYASAQSDPLPTAPKEESKCFFFKRPLFLTYYVVL